MSAILWILIIVGVALVLGYRRAPLWQCTLATLLVSAAIHFTGNGLSLLTWGLMGPVMTVARPVATHWPAIAMGIARRLPSSSAPSSLGWSSSSIGSAGIGRGPRT